MTGLLNIAAFRYYQRVQTTTREDVLACFRLLLGREPNAEEVPGHLGFVGAPLDGVVSGYLHSLEFRNRGLLHPTSEADLVDLDGFSVYVAKDDYLIAPAIRTGRYEPEVTRTFLEHMAAGAVIDIGANCGYFALLAASRGAPVYAFEPLQKNLRLLHASIASNHFDHVVIVAAAASDVPGTLTIGATHTNGIVGKPLNDPQAAMAAEYVAAVRVDDVVPSGESISLIKIDVEGHEYPAIAGALRIIRESKPVIISEFSPQALTANSGRSGVDYLQLLTDLGYDISVIGNRDAATIKTIFATCATAGGDHIDIVAVPSSK